MYTVGVDLKNCCLLIIKYKYPKKNLPPVFKEVSVGENKKSKGKIVIGILVKDKKD